jgi:hypothetical protein
VAAQYGRLARPDALESWLAMSAKAREIQEAIRLERMAAINPWELEEAALCNLVLVALERELSWIKGLAKMHRDFFLATS